MSHTVNLKLFLHTKPAEKYESANVIDGFQYNLLAFEDMKAFGYTFVQPVDLTLTLPEGFDPRQGAVQALEAKRAEFEARIAEINLQIQQYLALEA